MAGDWLWDWMVFAGAFLFGLAVGWLFWGGRKRRSAERETAAPGELEQELDALKAELAENEAEDASLSEKIDALDAAIKRANGRLKLLMRGVKKAER